jgi:hypothetical protein
LERPLKAVVQDLRPGISWRTLSERLANKGYSWVLSDGNRLYNQEETKDKFPGGPTVAAKNDSLQVVTRAKAFGGMDEDPSDEKQKSIGKRPEENNPASEDEANHPSSDNKDESDMEVKHHPEEEVEDVEGAMVQRAGERPDLEATNKLKILVTIMNSDAESPSDSEDTFDREVGAITHSSEGGNTNTHGAIVREEEAGQSYHEVGANNHSSEGVEANSHEGAMLTEEKRGKHAHRNYLRREKKRQRKRCRQEKEERRQRPPDDSGSDSRQEEEAPPTKRRKPIVVKAKDRIENGGVKPGSGSGQGQRQEYAWEAQIVRGRQLFATFIRAARENQAREKALSLRQSKEKEAVRQEAWRLFRMKVEADNLRGPTNGLGQTLTMFEGGITKHVSWASEVRNQKDYLRSLRELEQRKLPWREVRVTYKTGQIFLVRQRRRDRWTLGDMLAACKVAGITLNRWKPRFVYPSGRPAYMTPEEWLQKRDEQIPVRRNMAEMLTPVQQGVGLPPATR